MMQNSLPQAREQRKIEQPLLKLSKVKPISAMAARTRGAATATDFVLRSGAPNKNNKTARYFQAAGQPRAAVPTWTLPMQRGLRFWQNGPQ
jgi:hypothetical protein